MRYLNMTPTADDKYQQAMYDAHQAHAWDVQRQRDILAARRFNRRLTAMVDMAVILMIVTVLTWAWYLTAR